MDPNRTKKSHDFAAPSKTMAWALMYGQSSRMASEEDLGLIGMQERLNGIGGTLSIDSARGRGTRLLIQLPTETSNANSHRAG